MKIFYNDLINAKNIGESSHSIHILIKLGIGILYLVYKKNTPLLSKAKLHGSQDDFLATSGLK